MSWLGRLTARLAGTAEVPPDFSGTLDPDEIVLAVAHTEQGPLLATHLGCWLPEGRRIGWHLLSKATWRDGVLTITEAEETSVIEGVVVLRDQPARRLKLTAPSRLPDAVHERVNGSIRSRHHRDLPGGGAWVVQRKSPGRDGIVLQIRPDPGTDEQAVTRLATTVAEHLRQARGQP